MIVRRPDQVKTLGTFYKNAGYAIVLTGGVFDWLHPGHVRSFQDALGLPCLLYNEDRPMVLFVAINEDISAEFFKREPSMSQEYRAVVLDALSQVEGVILFNGKDPSEIIRLLRPHYYVKGDEYKETELPEKAALDEAHTWFIPCKKRLEISTTQLIKRGTKNAKTED